MENLSLWIGGVSWPDYYSITAAKGNTLASNNNAQISIITGLDHNLKKPIDIISGPYFPAYPKYKEWGIASRVWSHTEGSNDFDIPFINLPIVLFISKAFNMFKYSFKWIKRKGINKEHNIYIYGMHFIYLLPAYYLKKVAPNCQTICIVPDLPQFMDLNLYKKPIKRFFKKIDWVLTKKFMKKIDKYILFSKHMAEYLDLKPEQWTVMEGSINGDEFANIVKDLNSNKKVIMYSGVVDEKYGLKILMDAFQLIKDDNYELWITGVGRYVNEIKELAKNDSRIKYIGFLEDRKDVLRLEKNANLLVNMRLPTEEASKYCFPSKLFEYMISGTPVATFRIEGIPEEYFRYLVTFESLNIEDVAKVIIENCECSYEEQCLLGEQARKFILENKTNIEQGKKIIEFISKE